MSRVRAALVLAGCLAGGPWGFAAEGPLSLEVQELRGRVADLEQRIAFEVGERDALTARLGTAEAALAACRSEAEASGRRTADLDRRLRQCEEAEGGGRADLDLCRRGRAAAEEQRDALRLGAEAAAAERAGEAQSFRRELEDCRGRLAGAEAQVALSAAEARKRDLEAREKVEEVTCNYDRLLADVKAGTDALRKRVSELEAEASSSEEARAAAQAEGRQARERLAALEAEAAALREEEARRRATADRLREALREALGPRTTFALLDDEDRAAAQAPAEALFAPRSTDLRPAGQELLRRVAALVRSADLSGSVAVSAPSRVPEALLKRYPTPWELAAAYAAKVARFLEREGGVPPERLSAGVLPPASPGPAALVLEVAAPAAVAAPSPDAPSEAPR